MLPVLLDLKIFKVYTFGVFLVLAMFWGLFWLWRNIKLTPYKEEDVFDGFFLSTIGALFFSRLFFVGANWGRFGFNFLKFILINGYPGLSFYGAVGGGVLTFYVFFRSKKILFSQIVDYLVPPLFLALAIGKIGSFLSGVDVGSKTKFFFSIVYLGHSGSRHLTALYESLIFFILAYISQRFLYTIRRQNLFVGFNWVFFIFSVALLTLLLDKLKENHLYLVGLNLNMTIAALLFVISGGYFLYYFRLSIRKLFYRNFRTIRAYGYKTYRKINHRTAEKTHS